jgi:chromosome segregation ATPase
MAGPGISIEDVRRVVGDANPHDVGAQRVREVLGSGSLSTIQRALASLREEWDRQQALPVLEVRTPPAPQDVLAGLWSAAYEAATARVQNHLADQATKLLGAQEALKTASGDLMEAQAEVDRLADELDTAKVKRGAALEAAEAAASKQAEVERALREATLTADAERQRMLVEHERTVHDLRTQVQTLEGVVERSARTNADLLTELRRELESERSRVADLTKALAGQK